MPDAFEAKQALAAAMRADEELDVEALLERLQPVADQSGAGVGLAGRERLDQRLAAGALVEQFNVEIVLGVDALGDAEAERRMAGGDLGPGEPNFRRGRGDRRREDLAAERAAGRGDADGACGLEERRGETAGRRLIFDWSWVSSLHLRVGGSRGLRSLPRRLIDVEAPPAASSACDEVVENVVGMLDADREPHISGRHAGRELLLRR